jgi:signal transduction histidine kinase
MNILKNIAKTNQNTELLYLLDFYAQNIQTQDLDKTIQEANSLIAKTLDLKNIIFFSLFNQKLELHSFLNNTDIEVTCSLIDENFLLELKNKKQIKKKDKTFFASFINQHMLAFFVFVGEIENPKLLEIHNNFISNLIAKEKTINDLISHSQESTLLEEKLNNTLSIVSHELRTPLANIMGFSELILNNKIKAEDQNKYLKEIFFAAQRLGGIVDNFLDFAKIKNGNLVDQKNFSLVSLEDLCFKAWKASLKPNQKAEISWLIDTKLEDLNCDEAALFRVMVNLFTNAIKYSQKEDTKIICEIKQEAENQIKISVKDNGPGITAVDLEKIFDKFFRCDNVQKNFISGSGLGLWICKEIIEAHGGKIHCKSQINEGTEFSIILRPKFAKQNRA